MRVTLHQQRAGRMRAESTPKHRRPTHGKLVCNHNPEMYPGAPCNASSGLFRKVF